MAVCRLAHSGEVRNGIGNGRFPLVTLEAAPSALDGLNVGTPLRANPQCRVLPPQSPVLGVEIDAIQRTGDSDTSTRRGQEWRIAQPRQILRPHLELQFDLSARPWFC